MAQVPLRLMRVLELCGSQTFVALGFENWFKRQRANTVEVNTGGGKGRPSCRRFFWSKRWAPRQNGASAASYRVRDVECNGTSTEANWHSEWSGSKHHVNQSWTSCARVRQSERLSLLKIVTKVIPGYSDEVGGCRNASPGYSEGLAERKKLRGRGN